VLLLLLLLLAYLHMALLCVSLQSELRAYAEPSSALG
jgi:hypothetical protein